MGDIRAERRRGRRDDAEPALVEAPSPAAPVVSRRVAFALLVPVAVAVVASQIGDALTTTLADTHPAALMTLNARNRVLLLVSNEVDALTFYGIGTVRLMLTDPLYFLIGVYWGPNAIAWIGQKTGGSGGVFARLLAWTEAHFERAAIPFILVMPNPFISMMAGAARMSAAKFFAVNFIGTVGRLYLLRRLGSALEDQIDGILGFFADFRLPLLAVSVVLISVAVVRGRRRGTGELGVLQEIEEELVGDEPNP